MEVEYIECAYRQVPEIVAPGITVKSQRTLLGLRLSQHQITDV